MTTKLKQVPGHKNIATTRIYLHVAMGDDTEVSAEKNIGGEARVKTSSVVQ